MTENKRGKRNITIAIIIAAAIIFILSMRFFITTVILGGIGIYDFAKPYDKQTGIENYDKAAIIETYGSDLDSALFTFPDSTENALSVTFESSLKTGLFDTDGRIFLIATYTDEDFTTETDRLSQITCTVFDTNYDDSDYHIGEIQYDTDSYNYPAYVASDGFSSVYEYALIDNANNRIIYALLSHPDLTDTVILSEYADYLKKDKAAYITTGSTLNNFSIYSFSFTKDIWAEYTPEDEGRVTTGNPR